MATTTPEHGLETSAQEPYSGASQAWQQRLKGTRAGLDNASLRDAYEVALETRASIITGKYPSQHGAYHQYMDPTELASGDYGLPPEALTLAEVFRDLTHLLKSS